MFEQLNELMDKILKVENDFSKYKNARDARKLLQQIKQEAQALRFRISGVLKNKENKDKE